MNKQLLSALIATAALGVLSTAQANDHGKDKKAAATSHASCKNTCGGKCGDKKNSCAGHCDVKAADEKACAAAGGKWM